MRQTGRVSTRIQERGRNASEWYMVDWSLPRVYNHEDDTPSATMAFDFPPASVFARGDYIVRHTPSVTRTPRTERSTLFSSLVNFVATPTLARYLPKRNIKSMCGSFSERVYIEVEMPQIVGV